jgi:uncharacterized small protein (DUF1192 family)
LIQKVWYRQNKRSEALAFIDELNEKYSLEDDEIERLKAFVGGKK